VEPQADREMTAERRSTSEFGSAAATSAWRAVVMITAVAAMAVATAVVDGNAA
jgi:anti-sigma-K factor RskA